MGVAGVLGQGPSTSAGAGKLLLLPSGAAPPPGSEEEKIYMLITELLDPETRETALLELSKKREMYEDLALVLWGGFGEYLLYRLPIPFVALPPGLSPPRIWSRTSADHTQVSCPPSSSKS